MFIDRFISLTYLFVSCTDFLFFYYHCARAMCIFVYEGSPPFNSYELLDPTTPQFLYDFILWLVLL